jgi:short-chain fatty acids transporter
MSILARFGLAVTRWTERWVPDSWVIAVFLTLVVAVLATTVGRASPAMALEAWGKGLWALLTLAMQFTLMMVVSYACAVSPPVKRLFEWMASCPDPERPRQAIILMGLFSTVTAWLNWAFSLVVCAAFLPFLVRANPRADFRLLVTCAYLGLGTIWHTGLSGSAPLIIATPDNFLVKSGVLHELVPTSRTMFSAFNLGYALVAGLVGLILVALLVPPADRILTVTEEQTARLMATNTLKTRPIEMIPAERLEW